MAEQISAAQQVAMEDAQQNPQGNTEQTDTGHSRPEFFIQGYQRRTITLPHAGGSIEIQRLGPGDHLAIYGSPVHAMMTSFGLDATTPEAREDFLKGGGVPVEIVYDTHLMNCRRVMVKAVTSIKFSLLQQHLCEGDDVSVYQISDQDTLFIYNEVDKLSGWSADVDRFQGTVSETDNEE